MKVCINCYTENPLDAVLCSKCGMSLTHAPTGEEAVKLRQQRMQQRQQPPSASGIVYLFGEQFATPWKQWVQSTTLRRGLRASAYLLSALSGDPGPSHFPGEYPVRVPCSGQEVHQGELSNKLLEAAFVFLAEDGYISLRVEKRKTLLHATEAVAISRGNVGDDLPPSLERAIMDALSRDPKENWVKAVVRRVIGRTRFGDPSQRVVNIVIEGLVQTGWLFERGVVPTEEERALLAPFAGEAQVLKARLHTFATVNSDLHSRLLRDVNV